MPHWGGEVSTLKAITGSDPIRYERKGVQTGRPFTYEGMILIASNENIQTTDQTSGLSRRRITVPFNHIISESEKAENPEFGYQLQNELAGLFNKLLLISDTEVTENLRNPCATIRKAKHEAELDTNTILSCINDSLTKCDAGNESQVGVLSTGWSPYNLDHLYPNYVNYCEQRGKQKTSLFRFSSLIIDNCISRGIKTTKGRSGGTGKTIIRNLRLKTPGDGAKKLFCE